MMPKVTVLPYEGDDEDIKRDFYRMPLYSRKRSESDNEVYSKPREGDPRRCDVAGELKGSFVNDPYYKVKK